MNISKLNLLLTSLLRLYEPFELDKFPLHNSKKRLLPVLFHSAYYLSIHILLLSMANDN